MSWVKVQALCVSSPVDHTSASRVVSISKR